MWSKGPKPETRYPRVAGSSENYHWKDDKDENKFQHSVLFSFIPLYSGYGKSGFVTNPGFLDIAT